MDHFTMNTALRDLTAYPISKAMILIQSRESTINTEDVSFNDSLPCLWVQQAAQFTNISNNVHLTAPIPGDVGPKQQLSHMA
ncbi:hypothetical protein AOLI_G00057800 [Acnodon oligacanthus]